MRYIRMVYWIALRSLFLFAVCTVEFWTSIYNIEYEEKIIINKLYANLLLHSFAKFYEPENRIRKKELFAHFLFLCS